MIDEIKNLWSLCFSDTDDFVNLYFEKRYADERNVAVVHDGVVVSALQLIPYPMTFCGQLVDTQYLSGVCTHPDFRKRGFMQQLMNKAHQKLFRQNVLFSTLIPANAWLFNAYADEGYTPIFKRNKKNLYAKDFAKSEFPHNIEIEFFDFKNIDEVYDYFNQKMQQRACCVQHTKDDFCVIIDDIKIKACNGLLLIARQGTKITGLCFFAEIEEKPHITELLTDTDIERIALINSLFEKINADKIICIEPAPYGEGEKLGMLRIVCAEQALDLYAKTHIKCNKKILVEDKNISENNGLYILANGNCEKKSTYKTYDLSLNITQLADFMFADQLPYMSLMLNE